VDIGAFVDIGDDDMRMSSTIRSSSSIDSSPSRTVSSTEGRDATLERLRGVGGPLLKLADGVRVMGVLHGCEYTFL
jgi:hypothetical protein